MNEAKKILIVGGVAGGASCATRIRRLSEQAEIILFDRGAHVSFANCGLPDYVGNIIADQAKLLMATPALFKERFNIDIRLHQEVLRLNLNGCFIDIKDLRQNTVYRERFDELVLATGATPVRPPLPGIELPGIFALRTIPDSNRIRQWITATNAKKALVVGGGFIGMEMSEKLVKRGLEVTLVEHLPQVMPPFDAEMVLPIQTHLQQQGVQLHLGDKVTGFTETETKQIRISCASGTCYDTDLTVLAMGVKPETQLARQAGLWIGDNGGIHVDEHMQASAPKVWAVGDVVEVQDLVTKTWKLAPLAGAAQRQGRIAADNICGRTSIFRGGQGTMICRCFDMTLAATGASEKALQRSGLVYRKVYLHPDHHAHYFPNAHPIDIKLLFSPVDGRILGAQAVGWEGVDKRIDVLALAIQNKMTVYDLEESELCYAPQFGAAQNPINLAGMLAANLLRGDAPVAYCENIDKTDALILDVRDDASR